VPRRLLALLLAGLVLAVAGCADDVSPAVRVGSSTLSNDELLDEIEQWVGNPVAVDATQMAGVTPGAYPGELVRQLIRQRIDFMVHNEEFEAQGLTLDDDLRETALTALFGDPSGAEEAFSAFSDEFAAEFTDDVARQIAVQEALGDEGYSAWIDDAYAELDIEVNPRYGTWDEQAQQIVAPPAAQPAPSPADQSAP